MEVHLCTSAHELLTIGRGKVAVPNAVCGVVPEFGRGLVVDIYQGISEIKF